MIDVRITGALDYDLIGEIIQCLKSIPIKKKNSEEIFSSKLPKCLKR